MRDERCFLDTNIILYCYADDEPQKRAIALDVANNIFTCVSTQVIKETCNILHKKLKLSWQQIELVVDEIENNNEIVQVKLPIIRKAFSIAERYKLQWYDSIIIAAALETDCAVLYSEDLQNDFKIGSLVIKNPF